MRPLVIRPVGAGIRAAVFLAEALLLLVVSGCSASPQPAPTPATPVSVVGTWTESSDPSAAKITFKPGGAFIGFDGCNTHSGTYRMTGGAVSLVFTSSTESACAKDVWLEHSRSVTVDHGDLVFSDDAGRRLGVMTRS